MTDILTDLSSTALTKAIKNNLYEFFRFLRRAPQTEFDESPKLIRWRTSVPYPWFNAVLCLQPAAEGDESIVDEVLAYFKSYDLKAITWWLEPHVQPNEWERYLLPRGFHYDASTPGMAVDLQALHENAADVAELQITPVEDLRQLQTWTSTFVNGYELPLAWEHGLMDLMTGLGLGFPMRNYLGYLNGKPVATANAFFAAGVVGIQFIATVPAARRRGIGAALTLAPLREARQMGYRAGVLQSSELGYPVYERLGFQKLCQMSHYYWHDDTEQL